MYQIMYQLHIIGTGSLPHDKPTHCNAGNCTLYTQYEAGKARNRIVLLSVPFFIFIRHNRTQGGTKLDIRYIDRLNCSAQTTKQTRLLFGCSAHNQARGMDIWHCNAFYSFEYNNIALTIRTKIQAQIYYSLKSMCKFAPLNRDSSARIGNKLSIFSCGFEVLIWFQTRKIDVVKSIADIRTEMQCFTFCLFVTFPLKNYGFFVYGEKMKYVALHCYMNVRLQFLSSRSQHVHVHAAVHICVREASHWRHASNKHRIGERGLSHSSSSSCFFTHVCLHAFARCSAFFTECSLDVERCSRQSEESLQWV